MILDGNNLYPESPNEWLYKDEGENRVFFPSVTLSRPENQKYYGECTDEEKKEWEEEHKPEPEQQTEE